ncbi:MAG: ABC transporter ATP-binding protein [Armatimonadetes bacterium]|nr:ABC transporter ATP-binding protein [Armatimonadota bacterium]
MLDQAPRSESSAEEDLKIPAPFASLIVPEETPRAFAESDMTPEGSFQKSFLLVTDRRILSFTENGHGPEIISELPLSLVTSLNKRDLGPQVVLEAHTEDRAVLFARYTRFQEEGMKKAAAAIQEALGSAKTLPVHDSHQRSRDLCEKCGKPIPHWMGVCYDCLEKRQLFMRLLVRIKPYWGYAVASFLLMLALAALDLVQPIFQKILIDRVIGDKQLWLLWWIMGAILGIHAANALLSGVRAYVMAWFGEKLIFDLRTEIYQHLQDLSLSYYDRKESGWILDRVTSDTGNLQDFLSEGFQDILRDMITLLVIGIIMFTMNWKLALLTLAPSPLLAVLTYRFMHRSRKLWHWVWRKRARITTLLSDVIPGVRVVKAFAQEDTEQNRFIQRSQEYMDASVQAARVFATFWPTTGFITSLGFISIWGYGGYLVITGQGGVTLGVLVAFINYLWRFYGPLQNLSRMSQRIQRAATAAQRVFEVLDSRPDVPDNPEARAMPAIRGEVEFRDVTFGYEPNKPVLKDVSFKIAPGEMIGLVGPSGAGKSTTINVLCRFYDVEQGAVLIDGIDIRDVTLQSLRSQIGVVLQEPYLFHGTIADNIAYGKADATRDEIIRAAKAANAHDFITRMPDAYDTMVGERGTKLSGGERQRISIARAILKDPAILILDEATSSVDTEAEAQIRQALDRLVEGRTTFAIAHRFSTLRNADRLVVLDDGKIAEIGTHEELMNKEGGLFRRLTDVQNELARIIAVGG